MIKKLWLGYAILKIIAIIVFIIAELQSLHSGLEYRYQYLLILYLFVPITVFVGIIEAYGLKRSIKLDWATLASPFLLAAALYFTIEQSFGKGNFIQTSWILLIIFIIGLILSILGMLKIKKTE